MLVYCLISLWLSWQQSRLLTESKYISQKITLYFWKSTVSSCKSLTYNIYTLFCIIHIHLHTLSQKHHIWKWIHLDFWGFAVQIAKMHLHTFDKRELGECFYIWSVSASLLNSVIITQISSHFCDSMAPLK